MCALSFIFQLKVNSRILSLILLISSVSPSRSYSQDIQSSFIVMTYNIRYNNPNDPEPWHERITKIASVIKFNKTDIVGIQEGLEQQLIGLDSLLDDYSRLGAGRDDGKTSGEYCAIYYRKSKYTLVNSGTYWLSENPMLPGSIGWDAAQPRIATFAILREKSSSRELCVFNTHLDHQGKQSRIRSAQLISALINREAGRRPFMVLGDFNEAAPGAVWQWFNSNESGMIDPAESVVFHGPKLSYNAFSSSHTGESGLIDHIFISRDIPVLRYGLLSEAWLGLPPSDHYPVLGEFLWPR